MRTHARCVATTRLGIETLARFGIAAEPLPVNVRVLNAAAAQWCADGMPGGDEEMQRRGGWMLGGAGMRDGAAYRPTTRPIVGPAWNGHLVVLVPDRGVMLDLDARQFCRPERGIVVPDALLMPWHPEGQVATAPNGLVMTYEPRRDPLTGAFDHSYTDAPDWLRRHDDLVRALESRIRAGK